MMLMEYAARNLLAEKGIPVPRGVVIDDFESIRTDAVEFPAVLKAQVPTGGRGKAGGIKVVNDLDAAREAARQMLGMEIKGHKAERLLLAEKVECERELFLSIILDRKARAPVVIFSAEGGVDIEELARVAPARVVRAPVNIWTGMREYTARYLLGRAGLDLKYTERLHDVLQRLYRVYWDYDCLLAEINPLMIDRAGRLVAADAKISIDESALSLRQPALLAIRDELERKPAVKEARQSGFLFIPIHANGNVAVMSNGSGMLMASLDALQQHGCRVGAALDLGGGATSERIAKGIGIVMSQPGIKALFVNIFGGITRCDEVAGGVKDALGRTSPEQFIIARMEGTNKAQGKAMLKSLPGGCFVLVNALSEAAEVMRERMKKQ